MSALQPLSQVIRTSAGAFPSTEFVATRTRAGLKFRSAAGLCCAAFRVLISEQLRSTPRTHQPAC